MMNLKKLTLAIGLASAIASGNTWADIVPVIDAIAIEKRLLMACC